MEVPLNIIHNYVGLPVIIGVVFDTFRRYRVNRNPTTLYLGWTAVLTAIALFFFGIPVLFTQDTWLLSIGTLIGDIALMGMFVFLWFMGIRGTLERWPVVKNIALFLVVVLAASGVVEAFFRNLSPPYSTHVIANGSDIAIMYKDTLAYQIISGINSISLLLLGSFFWRQAYLAPNPGQRLRIKGLAVGFLFMASSFIVTPTFPIENQAIVSTILLTIGLSIVGIANVVGQSISRKHAATQDSQNGQSGQVDQTPAS